MARATPERLLLLTLVPGAALTVSALALGHRRAARAMEQRLHDSAASVHEDRTQRLQEHRRLLGAAIERQLRAEVAPLEALAAGAGQAVRRRDAPAGEHALRQAEDLGRSALEALRLLLDELPIDPDRSGALSPAERLRRALAQVRAAGAQVLERGDPALSAPAQVLAAAGLIEAVGAHAPDARLVRATHRPDRLDLLLAGHGRAPVALTDPRTQAGLRERARLQGGDLRLTQRPWGWSVAVALGRREAPAPGWRRRLRADQGDRLLAAVGTAIVVLDVSVLPVARPVLSAVLGISTAALPLAARRRHPQVVCALAGCGLVVGAATDALPSGPVPGVLILTVVPFSSATHAPTLRGAVTGTALTATGALGAEALRHGRARAATSLPAYAGYGALVASIAWFARRQRGLALALAADAESLGLRHPELLRATLEDERARVAAELHDLAAHGLTLTTMLAAAARQRVVAGDWRTASEAVDGLARAAETTAIEVERLIGAVLTGTSSVRPELALVHDLAEQARRGGHPVTLVEAIADPGSVSADAVTVAFQAVRESLANVRRHAGGAPTEVSLRTEEHALRVLIRNDPPPAPVPARPGGRRGLRAIRRRATELGGSAATRATPGGGFEVEVVLPLVRG